MAPKSSVQTIVMVILNSVPFLKIPKSRSYVFSQTTLSLPDTLKSHPYLQETYGKVGFSATGIFQHYAGGFSGNVLDMDPISSIQRLSILKTLVADKAETLGLPVDLTVAMLAGKHLQAANEGENELANAKFALETADAALMSDDADTVEVAQEFYSKACFMLGRWHKRGNNLNWSNYYVAKGLELKVGIVPKYTSGIRDAQAQRIPLVNLVSLLVVLMIKIILQQIT